MSTILEKSRYIAALGTAGLLIAAVATFLWGFYQAILAVALIVQTAGAGAEITIALIQIVDTFLIATTLLIFAVSLYELFISDLNVPRWMVAHDLYALKSKLGSMIVLVLAVKFVEKLVNVQDYGKLLQYAAAVTLVSLSLIAFSYFGQTKESSDH